MSIAIRLDQRPYPPRRERRHMVEAVASAPSGRLAEESIWNSRIFMGEWQRSKGGVTAVNEPATGAQLTKVGLAGEADVAEAAAIAAAAQSAWADAAPTDRAKVFRAAARLLEDQAPEIVPWIVRETGAVAPKAEFEIQMALGILHKAAAMPTEPQGQVLPSAAGQISLARRVP